MSFMPFQFDEAQAMIAAKWQLGVRNRTNALAVAPFAVIFIYQMLAFFKVFRIPLLKLTMIHFLMAGVYLMFIFYIYFRLQKIAEGLRKTACSVSFEGNCIAMQGSENNIFVTRNEDITRIDYGSRVFRFASKYGAYCLPRNLVPDALLQTLADAEHVSVREHNWM